MAVGTLGADAWANLWSGKLKFTDSPAVKIWDTFGKVLAFTNTDASGLSWQQATDRLVAGNAAFNIMGDWAAGYHGHDPEAHAGDRFRLGTLAFDAGHLRDGVGFLRTAQGHQGQDRDAQLAQAAGIQGRAGRIQSSDGSIAARLDTDLTKYNAYSQSAARDWRSNRIVGSLVHGAVAPESFMSQFGTVMDIFLAAKDPKAAANAAQAIADQVRLGM